MSTLWSDYDSSIKIEDDLKSLECELINLDKNFQNRIYSHVFYSFSENLTYKESLKFRTKEIKDNIELINNINKIEEYLGDYVDYNKYDPQIGDRMEIKKKILVDRIEFKKGQSGKIVSSQDGNLGIEFDELIFSFSGRRGHTCQHTCKDGHGWFILKNLVNIFPNLKSKYTYLKILKVEYDAKQKLIQKIEKIKNLMGHRDYESSMLVIDRYFKTVSVGDIVETILKENVDEALFDVGLEGKVVSIVNNEIGVEWNQPMINLGVDGNTCRNKCKDGHGWYVPLRILKRKISLNDKIEYLKTRVDMVQSAN